MGITGAPAPKPRRAPAPKARRAQAAEKHEDLADSAAQLTSGAAAATGPGPFAGLGPGEAIGALRFLGQQAVREPLTLVQDTPGAARELLRIAIGKSQVGPEKGDKRFADPAWRDNPLYHRAMQTYLYYGSRVDPFIDSLGIEGLNRERARFALALVREAMAPTNSFITNPAALKRMFDTGGVSVGRGMANMADDMLHNHGMPSMVDRKPFKVGETIAATPGAVIYRTEVFELIQYTPQTDTVYQRPILMVPPQVNKYYALDLSPGRSLYEYLLKHGIGVFGISWRNPTGAQRDWNFDTYAQATIEAIDVAREVSGSPDVNIMGGCLGGMTAAITQAHLAALGENKVHSVDDVRHPARLRVRREDAPLRDTADPRGRQEGVGPHRSDRRLADGVDVFLAASQRPGVELLGEQLPARPGPAGLRHPRLERGHNPADSRLPSPAAGHGGY